MVGQSSSLLAFTLLVPNSVAFLFVRSLNRPENVLSGLAVSPERVCLVDALDDEDAALAGVSKTLSEELSIPLIEGDDLYDNEGQFQYSLVVSPYSVGHGQSSYAIGIQPLTMADNTKPKHRKRARRVPNPYIIDFCPSQTTSNLAKRSRGQSGTDLLVKAVSPSKVSSKTTRGAVVYDLTAGFGRDSLILAQNGASKVVMVERDPFVATLLEDALRRLSLVAAQQDCGDSERHRNAQYLCERLSLVRGDGREIAQDTKCDICYLDPMFPPRTKSAAVKKDMQILHGLLGSQEMTSSDDTETELLNTALSAATSRVVVKRPSNAPPLGNVQRKVSYAIRGSVNRWDIYVV